MGDPAPNDSEIPPDQAAQLPGADEENHAPAIVAQPAMAVQAVSVANYQVHRQRNLASNQKIGHVEFGASKDFEKRLVSIKKAECPAKDSKCNKCFKKGHWAKACKSQLKKKVGEVSCPEVELEGEFFLGQLTKVDMVEGNSKESWKAEVKLNDHEVKFKVDTGADVTVIPPSVYHSLVPKPSLSKCTKTLMGPCKHKLCCLGNFTAKLCVDEKVIRELIYVVKDLERPLLGRDAAQELKLINRVDTVSSDDYKTRMASKHPQLFTGLGQMKDSYTITLKEDAKPFAISVPRKVPLPLYQKTKDELDRMLEIGVISPVDQPTDWCAPMVVTPKSNGKVRVCVNLSKLNEFVKRENHPLPAVDTTLGRLAGSTVFTKLDANSGFWQIKLAWESRPLTTFITPWGRFCFNVLPFGISSGSEKLQKTMNQILLGLEGVECNIDDVLIHGKDQQQHDERLEAVLKRLLEAGITLNLDKCVFSTKQVKFLRHVISSNGIEVDPDKVKAIADLPPPTNVQEVTTFLGMVNQLSKFSDHLTDKTKSIRELLLKGNQWTWGNAQQKAFGQIKTDLMRAPVLALYDPNKETKVAADASSYGLGGVVLQLQPDRSPVSFLSRALTPTASRCAQIEKEALALTWACKRSWEYIIGKSIYVETDHKPLVPLLSTHSLDQLPPRIQRFRMRLMRFHFQEISHVPGKKMYIADALSRLQALHADPQPTIADDEMTAHVASVITGLPASDTRLQQIIEAQEEDPVCRQIKTYSSEGWPDKHSVNDAMKPYWSSRGELTVVQNILLKGTRIVIPLSMRLEILDKIHEGHQGIVKCREDNKPEPLIATPLPDRPWQIVATDLFQMKGVDYLIVIDYYSRYVEVAAMTKTTKSSEIIRALKSIFAHHGIPEQVRSDNGPQYDSAEFSHFPKEWGFKHVTNSPRFPQANGEVKRGVRMVKNLLQKAEDPAKGLLAYRSTPLACKFSPAQLLMGRKLRNSVPMFHAKLNPHWPDLEKLHARESESNSQTST
nr:uncharacterized protein K02A2.6-like [Pocillopora verrucosa]